MLLKRHPTAVFRIGMLCLALSLVVGFFVPRVHLASENVVDAVRGVLLGISIGLLLLGLARKGSGT